MRVCRLLGIAAMFSAFLGQCAYSNTIGANFNVTIIITKQCTVTAPPTINLGTVGANDLISTVTTASQPFSVTCSSGTGYTIGFSSPNDSPSGGSTHVMKGTGSNTAEVDYQLVDTTSGATNTAPLTSSSSVISSTGTGAAQTRTLQAKVINYTTAVAPDTYTDTVTMTVTY